MIATTPALKRSIAKEKAQRLAAQEEKRRAELARKRAEEEKRRQEKLQKEKELAEKEKAAYEGKLLFSIVRAEDLLVDDIEKDDTGKIVSVDIQVGCSYGLKITNYLKGTAFIDRFQLQSDTIEKSAEQVLSFFQLGAKLQSGKFLETDKRYKGATIARWLGQGRTTAPTEDEREELIKKYGCGSQKGSVYLSYDSPKSFLRVNNIRRLTKRKLKKLIAGNPEGVAPLRIKN